MVRNVGKGVSALAVDIYFSSFSSVTARIFCISQPERDLKEMNRSNTNNNIPTAPHALIIILGLVKTRFFVCCSKTCMFSVLVLYLALTRTLFLKL